MRNEGPIKLWHAILLGLFLIVIGCYEWWDLYQFEQTGGVKRVGRTTYVLYQMGGKNLVAAVTGGIGVIWLYLIYKAVRMDRASDAKLDELAEREARRDDPPQPEPEDTRDHDVATHPVEPPKGTPARMAGDQPFRSPPVNIVVVPTVAAQSAPAPFVAGDPDDKPKLLS